MIPAELPSTAPSDGTVIRYYNISENDGTNAGCPAAGTPIPGHGRLPLRRVYARAERASLRG
ncbi:hypothetical protein GCM10023083_44200 [Streptomyces phyllanthi]